MAARSSLVDAPEIPAALALPPLPRGRRAFRLLVATPRYLPLLGGVENHVYQVTQRLVRAGVQVTVLTADPGGKLEPFEWMEGVAVWRVRAWPAQRDYYFAPGIYQAIRHGRWDLVHCQSYHTFVAPLAMLGALRAHIPYLVTFHGGGHSSRLRHGARGIQIQMLRPLLSRAARLVAVANFEVEQFGARLGLPRDRFVVIPNGCDLPEPASPSGAEAWQDGPGTLILSVGRLERYKGHQRILAALPAILARRPDATLRILGEGPYEPALRRLAQQLGVADRVAIGAIPPRDRGAMRALLGRASLVTLLSEYETHPLAVLEAISLQCPALVADTSGLRELADRGLARAIPLESTPEQIAAAALHQLEQPLIPAPIALPTWDACATALLSLYHSVLQERRGTPRPADRWTRSSPAL
jgi:glycosyltransferase involved in cell wall biosynthesis